MESVWEKIWAFDDERRAIQNRIRLRAKQGRAEYGHTLTEEENNILKASPPAWIDAERYIWIQDQQWMLLEVRDTGRHEQLPL